MLSPNAERRRSTQAWCCRSRARLSALGDLGVGARRPAGQLAPPRGGRSPLAASRSVSDPRWSRPPLVATPAHRDPNSLSSNTSVLGSAALDPIGSVVSRGHSRPPAAPGSPHPFSDRAKGDAGATTSRLEVSTRRRWAPYVSCRPCAWSLTQVSFNVSVRSSTRWSGAESGSTQK